MTKDRKFNQIGLDSTKTPGPGHYQINNGVNMNKTPNYSIGKADRDNYYKHLSSNPGPGQYMPSSNMRPKSASWQFGSSMRRPLSTTESNMPGPGNYSQKSTLGNGPKVNYLFS